MSSTIHSLSQVSLLSSNNDSNNHNSQDSATNTIPHQNSNVIGSINSLEQQLNQTPSKSVTSSIALSSQEEETQLSKSMHPLGSAEEIEEDLLLFSSVSNPLKRGGVCGIDDFRNGQNVVKKDAAVDKFYKAKTGISPHEGVDDDAKTCDSNNKQQQLPRRKNPPSPLTLMSIEIHVQCRTGKAGVNDSKQISMKPDCTKDCIFAIVYVFACDPGEGEAMKFLERGCIFTPVEAELRQEEDEQQQHSNSTLPSSSFLKRTLGLSTTRINMEKVQSEKHLLLRFASIVQWKDPDALVSWDTLGLGIGHLVERGATVMMNNATSEGREQEGVALDMVRLLGRTPKIQKNYKNSSLQQQQQSKYELSFHGNNDGGITKNATSTGTETETKANKLVMHHPCDVTMATAHHCFGMCCLCASG